MESVGERFSAIAASSNITLKRDAPFWVVFEGCYFFRLRWLRQSSVTGAPLSFTLVAKIVFVVVGPYRK